MVKIEEEDEDVEASHMDSSSSSSLSSHHNTAPTSPSPPHTAAPPPSSPPPDSSSSISSDHTFHGFSPHHTPPAVVPVVANRLIRDQPEAVTKTESDAETGFAGERRGGGGGGGGGGRKERRQQSILRRARREKVVKRAGLGLRICEFVICLVSFSVMAADKNRGWALDSFDRYIEFRYSLSVNILGFAYSGLQGLDLLHQLTTGKDLVRSQLRCYFDFAMDQILAYLLLSASSSAFTRVDDWISNWGKDKFPAMASASVGMSFLAFVTFAFSSLISGYLLCTHRYAS